MHNCILRLNGLTLKTLTLQNKMYLENFQILEFAIGLIQYKQWYFICSSLFDFSTITTVVIHNKWITNIRSIQLYIVLFNLNFI